MSSQLAEYRRRQTQRFIQQEAEEEEKEKEFAEQLKKQKDEEDMREFEEEQMAKQKSKELADRLLKARQSTLANRKQLSTEFDEGMAEPLIAKTDQMDYGTHKHLSAQTVQSTHNMNKNSFSINQASSTAETQDEKIARQLHEQLNGHGSGHNQFGMTESTNSNSLGNNHHKQTPTTALFDEENGSVRTADQYNYEALVGEDSISYGHSPSCCELICGTPRDDEPKISLLCCNVSKRVLKNIVMFLVVLLVYIFFLSIIMGQRQSSSQ